MVNDFSFSINGLFVMGSADCRRVLHGTARGDGRMMYRKKPVVIAAWPVRDLIRDLGGDLSGGTWKNLPEPVEHAYLEGKIIRFEDRLHIHTLEGIMDALPDDMLIRGVKGELYPCKPDIFAATYDAVG